MCAFIHFWSGHGFVFEPQVTGVGPLPVVAAAADALGDSDALAAGAVLLAAADALADGVADVLAVGCGVIPP